MYTEELRKCQWYAWEMVCLLCREKGERGVMSAREYCRCNSSCGALASGESVESRRKRIASGVRVSFMGMGQMMVLMPANTIRVIATPAKGVRSLCNCSGRGNREFARQGLLACLRTSLRVFQVLLAIAIIDPRLF